MNKRQIVVTAIMSVLMLANASAINYRSIVNVKNISLNAPVGNAPRLPYQLWVEYADGKGEYRQVRWLNSSEATEQAEANPAINPVGTVYKVRGFIIGDNTTPNGFPVWAEVKVVENDLRGLRNGSPVAETLPLNKVSID